MQPCTEPSRPSQLPPIVFDPLGWDSLPELARRLGRPPRTVRRWVISGMLADFGIPSYLDTHRRWWVRVPTTI